MFITSYKYEDGSNNGWRFSPLQFQRINLLVGATGAGKSRLLNTLFNISAFVRTNNGYKSGRWEMEFRTNAEAYRWKYYGRQDSQEISDECLEHNQLGVWVTIYSRVNGHIKLGETTLPKLPNDSTGIYLLKEEELVAPVYEAFGHFIRRNFFGSELETACAIANIPPKLVGLQKKKDIIEAIGRDIPLNVRLYLLKQKDARRFQDVVSLYRSIFPSIENVDIGDGSELLPIEQLPVGRVPVVVFKERNVSAPIFLHELSSGMQKVLLLIADIVLAEPGSVIMIDEYENSLGVNAIDFLPDFITDYGEDKQFLITSHHPYLINNMPLATWQVFHRDGPEVTVKSGDEIVQRYGQSKQDAFIQLLNDPFYAGSI